MALSITRKNAKKVFDRILAAGPADQREILKRIDAALDELLDQDFFGTEGQNDPRGDRRGEN